MLYRVLLRSVIGILYSARRRKNTYYKRKIIIVCRRNSMLQYSFHLWTRIPWKLILIIFRKDLQSTLYLITSNVKCLLKFRFCYDKGHKDWKTMIHPRSCDKGLIMIFLYWICEIYLQTRCKRSKKKTVNQYWWDFKMLYRRSNQGSVVNANDCEEIVKVISLTAFNVFPRRNWFLSISTVVSKSSSTWMISQTLSLWWAWMIFCSDWPTIGLGIRVSSPPRTTDLISPR